MPTLQENAIFAKVECSRSDRPSKRKSDLLKAAAQRSGTSKQIQNSAMLALKRDRPTKTKSDSLRDSYDQPHLLQVPGREMLVRVAIALFGNLLKRTR